MNVDLNKFNVRQNIWLFGGWLPRRDGDSGDIEVCHRETIQTFHQLLSRCLPLAGSSFEVGTDDLTTVDSLLSECDFNTCNMRKLCLTCLLILKQISNRDVQNGILMGFLTSVQLSVGLFQFVSVRFYNKKNVFVDLVSVQRHVNTNRSFCDRPPEEGKI